jgi:hypothetical protein
MKKVFTRKTDHKIKYDTDHGGQTKWSMLGRTCKKTHITPTQQMIDVCNIMKLQEPKTDAEIIIMQRDKNNWYMQ